MSAFKIPMGMGLCYDIQKRMARLWWGSKEDRKDCTGQNGRRWVMLSIEESWGSETFPVLIKLWLQKQGRMDANLVFWFLGGENAKSYILQIFPFSWG